MQTKEILESRQDSHGDYATKAEFIQQLKVMMAGSFSWHLMTPSEQESLDNIAQKIGRICFGNPHFKDHWDDIAGYAVLVADQSEEVESTDDNPFEAIGQALKDLVDDMGFKDSLEPDDRRWDWLRDGERQLSPEEIQQHFKDKEDAVKETSEESREEVREETEETPLSAILRRTTIGQDSLISFNGNLYVVSKATDNNSEECHH